MVVHGAGIPEHGAADLGTSGTDPFAGRGRLPFAPRVHPGPERSDHRSFSAQEVGVEKQGKTPRAPRTPETANAKRRTANYLFEGENCWRSPFNRSQTFWRSRRFRAFSAFPQLRGRRRIFDRCQSVTTPPRNIWTSISTSASGSIRPLAIKGSSSESRTRPIAA